MQQIREYKPADRKACIAIFKSNMPLFFAPEELPGFESWLTAREERKFAFKNTKAEYYYVAEQDGKVIACAGFNIKKEDAHAFMTWGMVDNSLHKKGIGKALLEFRIKKIRSLFPDSPINVNTTQHSYRFFEKLGFVLTGITNDYYAKGLDKYDMIYK